MDWRERIVSDPQTMHGKPLVRGSKIPVSVVLDSLAAHVDLQEVLETYPLLSEDDVRACVAWAAGVAAPKEPASEVSGFKEFLRSMPDVGDDADFERPLDFGRPEIEWDS